MKIFVGLQAIVLFVCSFALASNTGLEKYLQIILQLSNVSIDEFTTNDQVIELCSKLPDGWVPLVAFNANFWMLVGDSGEVSLNVIPRHIIETIFRYKERRFQGFLLPNTIKERLIVEVKLEEILNILIKKSKREHILSIQTLLLQDEEVLSEMIQVIYNNNPKVLFEAFSEALLKFKLDEKMLQRVSKYFNFTDFLSKIRTLVSNRTFELFKLCFPKIDFVKDPREQLQILDLYSHDKYGKLLFEERNPKKEIKTALAVLRLQKLLIETNCANCNVYLLENIKCRKHLDELVESKDRNITVLALQVIRLMRSNSLPTEESLFKFTIMNLPKPIIMDEFIGTVPIPLTWIELTQLHYMHTWHALSHLAREYKTLDIIELINLKGIEASIWQVFFNDYAEQMLNSLSQYPGLSSIIRENIKSFNVLKERVKELREEFTDKHIIELGAKNFSEIEFDKLDHNSLSSFYNLWVDPTSQAMLKWLAKQPFFLPHWKRFLQCKTRFAQAFSFRSIAQQLLLTRTARSGYIEILLTLPIDIITSIQIKGGLTLERASWEKYLQLAYEKMLYKWGHEYTLKFIFHALFRAGDCTLKIKEKKLKHVVGKLIRYKTLELLHRANIRDFDENKGLSNLCLSHYWQLGSSLEIAEWKYEQSKDSIMAFKYLLIYLDGELDYLQITGNLIVDSLLGMLKVDQTEDPTPFKYACIKALAFHQKNLSNIFAPAFYKGGMFEQELGWTKIAHFISTVIGVDDFADYAMLVGWCLGKYIKVEGLPHTIARLEEWIKKNSRNVSELEELRITRPNTWQVIITSPFLGCLTVPGCFQPHMITEVTITEKLWAWMLKNAQALGFDQKGWFQALKKKNETRITPLDLVSPLRDRLGGRYLSASSEYVEIFDQVYGFFETNLL